ncbi:T6SS effector amidase Tae4 family protein [uncultured Kriegella sp.]|uniref:T6SS effector amidase Tae4 family protein n=1 Tax=uncultured Kriegella sp. TaxID=1798910 RepID=UPI0030DCFDA9|tara:strand:- start:113561 stop:114826 length:1266 start_codon:yes stop_codon:yes gene_type:complete
MRVIKFLFVFVVIIFSQTTFAQKKSVEIWIRAFIPNAENSGAAGDYIKEVGGKGSVVKLTACPFNRPTFACFSTDDRSFSTDCSLTSRVETKFTIQMEGEKVEITPKKNRSSIKGITKFMDCETGKMNNYSTGIIERDHLGKPYFADGQVQIIGQVQTVINIIPVVGEYVTPSIDYSFDIIWSPNESKIKMSLTAGNFPAIEAYVRTPGNEWQNMFQNLPLGTPCALFGDIWGGGTNRNSKEISLNPEIPQQTKITFSELKEAFPIKKEVDREKLFTKILKGGWPELLPDTINYRNTCAIRLSVALNKTKLKIEQEFSNGNHKDSNGNFITVNVPTMRDFLNGVLGDSNWGMSMSSVEEFNQINNIPIKQGIILYTFPRSCNGNPITAFGHVDLWDGKKCLSDCPPGDTNCAVTIELWELD